MKCSILIAAVALIPAVAMAQATPGVNDYVTAKRLGIGFPNCSQFQTANGKGDTENHTWLPCGTGVGQAVCYGIGIGTGINSLGPGPAGEAIGALVNSRWSGSSSGPFIQFTDNGAGYYQDCGPTIHGVAPLEY